MMKWIGKMAANLCRRIKRMLAAVLCHRAMHGLAAGVYGALACGLAGKEVVAWVLCGVYAVMFARG